LLSYDESYIPEVDVEGMISVKKKKNFSKRKWKEIVFINFASKIKKVLSEKSCCGVRAMMCCSLNYCQHFPRQMTWILKHKFWNKSFEEKSAHTLDIPRRLHWKRNYNHVKFVTLQEKDVYKTAWYKIMGISKSTYMNYKHENKRRCRILPHWNKGSQSNKPQWYKLNKKLCP
jgi:hypothetical protein